MTDPVTEACRQVRDRIVERSGGFKGYFDQLEEIDRQRLLARAAKKKTAKKPADTKKNSRKRST